MFFLVHSLKSFETQIVLMRISFIQVRVSQGHGITQINNGVSLVLVLSTTASHELSEILWSHLLTYEKLHYVHSPRDWTILSCCACATILWLHMPFWRHMKSLLQDILCMHIEFLWHFLKISWLAMIYKIFSNCIFRSVPNRSSLILYSSIVDLGAVFAYEGPHDVHEKHSECLMVPYFCYL